MAYDPITDEIAYLLTKPARYAELMGDNCDALQCLELADLAALFAAERGEYGARIDTLREKLATILRGYEHACEIAGKSLDARDEYAHRAGRAA